MWTRVRVRRGAEAAHRVRELRLGSVPRRSDRRPVGRDHEGSQRGVVRDRRRRVTPWAERRSGSERPDGPEAGPLSRWIWKPRWIPGSSWRRSRSSCSSRRTPRELRRGPGRFRRPHLCRGGDRLRPARGRAGEPGRRSRVRAAGDRLRARVPVVRVPLAGRVRRRRRDLGRLRQANDDRAAAVARERLAGNRLHRLQAVTEVLARAMTPEDVAKATVAAAIEALGADAGGLTVRSGTTRRRSRCSSAPPWTSLPRTDGDDTDRYPGSGPGDRANRPADLHRDPWRADRAVPDRPQDRRRCPIRRVRRRPGRARGRGPRSAEPRVPPRSHGAARGARAPAVDRSSGGDRPQPHPVERG